jgi:hypothetical protein
MTPYNLMKQAALIPIKKIQAADPQLLITLKLRYNSLVDKINSNGIPEGEKEALLSQLDQLNQKISWSM